jgi:hypothetical protein
MSARGAVKIMQATNIEYFIIIKQYVMKLSATYGSENIGLMATLVVPGPNQ